MVYEKRFDGRKFDEMRKLKAKAGVIPNADGSAFFSMGKTSAYVAVYGPKNIPKFFSDPSKGTLKCYYEMMPFSGAGNRVKPGLTRRSVELGVVIERALLPVLDLKKFPNTAVEIYIYMLETDAGSRCVAINAASIALADAGIPMYDMVAALALGKVDDKLLVDINYDEEAYEGADVADMPLAIIPTTEEITLLQMDGPLNNEEILALIKKAIPFIKKINKVQKEALKNKFKTIKV